MQALNIRPFVFNFPSSWDYRPVPQGLDINNDFFSNVEVDLILLSPRHVGTLFWKWERSAGGGKFTGCPPLLRTRDCAASRHVRSSVPLSTDTVVVFEVGAEYVLWENKGLSPGVTTVRESVMSCGVEAAR